MIVYSANYGGFDNLIQQPRFDGVKYIMFTETPKEANGWDVVIDKRLPNSHPRTRAKWFKLHNHLLFKDQFSIWIDANNELLRNPTELLQYATEPFNVAKHPWRDCIYEEATFCKDMEKYKDLPILEQVEEYRRQGFPSHYGLWACNCLIRNEEAKEVNERWWEHNLYWTYQDQLSLPYLFWKLRVRYNTIPEPLFSDSKYIKLHNHNSAK